ncbi:MAG: phosphohydrolase [Desulfobacterales bacterium]|jgi:uncharacterized protein
MDPFAVIAEFYRPGSRLHALVRAHGEAVAEKALRAADSVAPLRPDRTFVFEAAVVHDIGIFLTDAPSIGCFGVHPYVAHGVLGRGLLDEIGFSRHGLVCERHVGVGITVQDIRRQGLPLPERDMRPRSLEETIVSYADKFFSKNRDASKERTPNQVVAMLDRYGADKVARFRRWMELFEDGSRRLQMNPYRRDRTSVGG